MIYYHFDDKGDLFRAALQNAIQGAFKLFEQQSESLTYQSAAKAIDAWFDVHVRLHHQLRNVIKISVDSSTLKTKRSFSNDPVAEFYRRESEILEFIIEKGIASEEFQPVNPRHTAIMISTILDGVLTRSFILDGFDLKTTVDDFKKVIKLHLITQQN